MSVVNNTIIVENRMEEMLAYLPDMSVAPSLDLYPVRFEYGDQFAIMDFLKTQLGSETPYPLVWLMTPYIESHLKTKVQVKSMTLILAVETNADMLPKQRMKETFEKVLIPLLTNLKLLFMRANIINVSREYDIVKYYNYSGDEMTGLQSETGDIWDAIKFTFDCDINDVCLRPILKL